MKELGSRMRDVTLIYCLDLVLAIPFVTVRVYVGSSHAEVAAAYMAIVGVVLSGWGIYAALKAYPVLRQPWMTFFYGLCFLVLLLFYGSAGLALLRGATL